MNRIKKIALSSTLSQLIEGRRPLPTGTERIRAGKKYIKNAQGGWDYVKDGSKPSSIDKDIKDIEDKIGEIETKKLSAKEKFERRMAEIAAKYDKK